MIDISYYLPYNPNTIKCIWLHHDEYTKHEINNRNILRIQRLMPLQLEDLSLEQQALVFVVFILLFIIILVVLHLRFQLIPLILHALVTLQTLYLIYINQISNISYFLNNSLNLFAISSLLA